MSVISDELAESYGAEPWGTHAGQVIVREDIAYLQDDPVIDPRSVKAHFETLGATLERTGIRRLLVQGTSQADGIDDAALVWLTGKLADHLPQSTGIAFAHAGYPVIARIADQVCELLAVQGIVAFAGATEAEAVTWLRTDGR